ncbi:hypothetical protein DV738_g2550, partial [Chaetothyriales sp. CBS 135597]
MSDAILSGLNAAQRTAVTSPASVLQVLAPPGSGKTKTLTTRLVYQLIHHSYAPENVICCTFTIKAAREMRDRVRGLVGSDVEKRLVLGTFHSICRRYLLAYGHLINIPTGFGIADSSDSIRIVKKILKDHAFVADHKIFRARISSHKAKGMSVRDLRTGPQTQVAMREFITVYEKYQEALSASNMLDYDDLLLRCLDLLRSHPHCVSNVEALLIDEFQDTNIVQFELMKCLSSARRQTTVVGDPDQSIYGFRSAEIENLKRMQAHYPETVVINLEQNYRSCSSILNLAQGVIEQDTERPQKKLKSTHCYGTLPVLRKLPNPREEAMWIAAEIKRLTLSTGCLLRNSDIAILLRSAYQSLLIEKALTSAGIAYRMVGGIRFFDRVEIRLIVDYLRTISHPENDQAFLSIINVPSRKIGDATVAALIELGQQKNISLWSAVLKVLNGQLTPGKTVTTSLHHELQKLVNLIRIGRQKFKTMAAAELPAKLIEYVIASLDLRAYIQKKYKEDYEDRLENVQELISHADGLIAQPLTELPLATIDGIQQQVVDSCQDSLDQFLANIVLATEVETPGQDGEPPRVTISTIHSAKGLEWPAVFVPAVYEGSIPHSRAEDTDEERRLLYVAMTRAQAMLMMSVPLVAARNEDKLKLTRFLPSKLHSRLADRGPSLSDDVIEGIAKTLRRKMPSQQAIAEGILKLADEKNAALEDTIWPLDGSHRSTTHGAVDSVVGKSVPASFPGFQKASICATTTMDKVALFSASSTTLGINKVVTDWKTADFFSKKAFARGKPAMSEDQGHSISIPLEFQSHKLGSNSHLLGQKRPVPIVQGVADKRAKYSFLTNKSPPSSHGSLSCRSTCADLESQADRTTPSSDKGAVQSERPFHTTSLAALKAQGRYGTRPLGVRRTLNG